MHEKRGIKLSSQTGYRRSLAMIISGMAGNATVEPAAGIVAPAAP